MNKREEVILKLIPPILYKILKAEGALNKFVHNIVKEDEYFDNYCEEEERRTLQMAFFWPETEEGHIYWHDLSELELTSLENNFKKELT